MKLLLGSWETRNVTVNLYKTAQWVRLEKGPRNKTKGLACPGTASSISPRLFRDCEGPAKYPLIGPCPLSWLMAGTELFPSLGSRTTSAGATPSSSGRAGRSIAVEQSDAMPFSWWLMKHALLLAADLMDELSEEAQDASC